jgi:hypothetical protein
MPSPSSTSREVRVLLVIGFIVVSLVLYLIGFLFSHPVSVRLSSSDRVPAATNQPKVTSIKQVPENHIDYSDPLDVSRKLFHGTNMIPHPN